MKQRIRNQYGQINGIIQVPVSYGTTPKNLNETVPDGPSTSEIHFNGDIYVGRYTEKNTTEIYHNHLVTDFIGMEKIVSKYL